MGVESSFMDGARFGSGCIGLTLWISDVYGFKGFRVQGLALRVQKSGS